MAKYIFPVIFFLFLYSECAAQTIFGNGLIFFNLNQKSTINLYNNPSDKLPVKKFDILFDKRIDNWNIRDIENQKKWLNPEVLWLEYSQFILQVKSVNKSWYQVVVNNETGKTYWLKGTPTFKYVAWPDYLKEMFSVARLQNVNQKIRQSPTDNAPEINYSGSDCFRVKAINGNWI